MNRPNKTLADLEWEKMGKDWAKMKKDYNVNTEQELADKLGNDCYTVPCVACHKEYCIDQLKFIGGDPYCYRCSR
jgi:hypothetical protein